MGNDVYEENKRLKRLLEQTEALRERDRERAADKNSRMADAMANFFIALAAGRVVFEEYQRDAEGITAWRINIVEDHND